MFTSDHQEALRRQLLELAEKDPRITGAAVTGSAADGRQDRWSDIDLFFGVAEHVELDTILSDWSDYLYGELAALHHFDLKVPPRSTVRFSCRHASRSTWGSPRPVGSARVARTSALSSARRSSGPRPVGRTPDTSSGLRGTTSCTLGAASNARSHGRPSTGSAAFGTRCWHLRAVASESPPPTRRGPTPCRWRSLASWRMRWCAALRWRSCVERFGWRQRGCSVSSMRPIATRLSASNSPSASWRTCLGGGRHRGRRDRLRDHPSITTPMEWKTVNRDLERLTLAAPSDEAR